uniref:Uncharacterized protein n=2 Tax=Arundo donax TaxID=35708 RepID=A0A0A9GTC3_ARUDO
MYMIQVLELNHGALVKEQEIGEAASSQERNQRTASKDKCSTSMTFHSLNLWSRKPSMIQDVPSESDRYNPAGGDKGR